MKAVKTFIVSMMLLVSTSAVAQPMSYDAMRNNARFLTDRMAYTLGISSLAIIDDLYRINFDYIYGINDYLDDIALGYRYDDYLAICAERDYALQMLLGNAIWSRLMGYDYFYRPVFFHNHRWHFGIYDYFDRGHWYYSAPRYYHEYRGGHFFGRMQPNRGIGVRGPGMSGYRGGPERPNSYRGGHDNRGGNNRGGYDRGPADRGSYGGYDNNRGGSRGSAERGGNTDRGNMDRGNVDRSNADRGNVERGNADRGGSYGSGSYGGRTESNVRSSSRGGSYGGSMGGGSRSSSSSSRTSTPTRSSSYGSGSSSSSRGGSYGGSVGGGSRSGGSVGGSAGGHGGHGGRR